MAAVFEVVSSSAAAFAVEGIGCLGPLLATERAESARHPRRPTTDEFINDQGCILLLSHPVPIRKRYEANACMIQYVNNITDRERAHKITLFP